MECSGGGVMERYSIGVSGNVQSGFDPSEVQQRLAALFKCQPEKALRLISGKPVMLKSGLDRQSAGRYLERLQKTGVEATITKQKVPVVQGPVSPAGSSIRRSESAGVAAMECPKCATRQTQAESCSRCGIVIAKFQHIKSAEENPPAVSAAPPSELEDLEDFVGHNFSAYRHKFQRLIDNQGKYRFHWHWPAFLVPFPWLIYRKLYIHATILGLFALIPVPFAGLALMLLCGALGNFLYFRHCRSKLAAVDVTGVDRVRAVASIGGTLSMPTTILTSLLVSGLVSFAGYQLYFKDQLNQFPSREQLSVASQMDGEIGKQTLGKMMVIGEFLRVYIVAEKMSGKQGAPPESIKDIQRIFKLDARAISDEWGTELDFVRNSGKSILVSAGPDREFSTADDLSYEVRPVEET